MKTRFYMALDEIEYIEKLSAEQAGTLFLAIMRYEVALTEESEPELPEMDALTDMVFAFIKKRLDAEHKAFVETCKKRKDAANKRWSDAKAFEEMQMDASAYEDNMQMDANAYEGSQYLDSESESDSDSENENEKLKEKGDTIVSPKKKSAQDVVDCYNEICVSLPKVVKLNASRKKMIKQRLITDGFDELKQVFLRAQDSKFLTGGNNTGWMADFDWLIKPANMTHVLEGRYDNRSSPYALADKLKADFDMYDEWAAERTAQEGFT